MSELPGKSLAGECLHCQRQVTGQQSIRDQMEPVKGSCLGLDSYLICREASVISDGIMAYNHFVRHLLRLCQELVTNKLRIFRSPT